MNDAETFLQGAPKPGPKDMVQVLMRENMARIFEQRCLGKGNTVGDTYLSGPVLFSEDDIPTYIIGVNLMNEDKQCDAVLFHGPGHQSKARCEAKGEHEVHETHYDGGQIARWRDGQYTDQLRAKGIEFDPESYPENMAMTGFFDEPPEEDE